MNFKQNKTKQNKTKLLFLSLFGTVSFCVAGAAAIIMTSNSLFLEKIPENRISFIGSKKQDYDYQDAFQKDVIQKAHSDSVLVYYINWGGVFHRFGSSSHLIKILELNPEKEIYFVVRKNVKINLTQIINNKEKFPNFNYVNINIPMEVGNIDSLTNRNYFPKEINNVIDIINKQNKKIDFYSDDFFMLKPIETIIKNLETKYYNIIVWRKIIENLFNDFKKIKDMNSINIFSDGTGSTDFFSNSLYKLFLLSGNKIDDKGQYISEKFIAENGKVNNIQNLSLFLSSLVTTNEKGNSFQKTKFFLPTLELVNEVNSLTATALETNENDFFNPYNSLEADLISFCSSFSPESFKLLNGVFSKEPFNLNDYSFMNDNSNYVYSGRLLSSADIDDEVNKLLQIKKSVESEGIEKYNIIFKGHPRDDSGEIILKKLKKRIKQLNPNDDASWLFTINPQIPYEIFLANGVFDDNKEKNKIVKLYTTFSTINLFLYAEDPSLNKIQKILINESEKALILYYYGENSKIFPKEKWQLNDEWDKK